MFPDFFLKKHATMFLDVSAYKKGCYLVTFIDVCKNWAYQSTSRPRRIMERESRPLVQQGHEWPLPFVTSYVITENYEQDSTRLKSA